MSDEKAVYTAEKAEVELAYVSADLGVTSGRPRGFTGGTPEVGLAVSFAP